MPKITISGRAIPPAAAKVYQQANYENRNVDLAYNKTYREAGYENRDRDLRFQQAYSEANYENRDRYAADRQMRAQLADSIRGFHTVRRLQDDFFNQQRESNSRYIRVETNLLSDELAGRMHVERIRRTTIEREATERQRTISLDRQNAEAENRERDQKHRRVFGRPGQYDAAHAANAGVQVFGYPGQYQRAWDENRMLPVPMSPAAGAGGAGGGGGGAGGGGGGHGPVPLLGGFGFPRAAGGLGRMLGVGVGAYIAGEVIKEVVTAPQTLLGLESSAVGASMPYIDFRRGVFAAARSGGFGGAGLYDTLKPGLSPAEWAANAGYSSLGALKLIQGFGVSPTGGNMAGVGKALTGMEYLPFMGGVDTSAHMRLMGSLGLVGANGDAITQHAGALSDIFANATARGMNKADVLRSIDAGVAMMSRNGAGVINTQGLADFLFHFGNSPSARSGEMGMSVAAGLQSANASVGSDPLHTMIYGQFAMRHFRTRGGVKAFMERTMGAGSYATFLRDNPGGGALIDVLTKSVQAGNTTLAAKYTADLINGNQTAQYAIVEGSPFSQAIINGQPELARPAAAAGLALQHSALPLLNYQNGAGIAGASPYVAGQEAAYAAGLRAQGVRPDLIPGMLAAAKRQGMNPVLLGAVLGMESSGGTDTKGMKNPANVMHWLDGTPRTEQESIEGGAAHYLGNLRQAGGNAVEAYRLYNKGARSNAPLSPGSRNKFSNLMRLGLEGEEEAGMAPILKENQNKAAPENNDISAGRLDYEEIGKHVASVNSALDSFAEHLRRVSRSLAGQAMSSPYAAGGM
ncbi:MAG: hypothetical protein M0Z28_08310 [Rhodospirillales bacterium]|nr:hypothetical protein [Rhodospirillales bacterium]